MRNNCVDANEVIRQLKQDIESGNRNHPLKKMTPARWQALKDKFAILLSGLKPEPNRRLRIVSLGCGDAAEMIVLMELRAEGKIEDFDYLGVDIAQHDFNLWSNCFSCRFLQMDATCWQSWNKLFIEDNRKFDVAIFRHPLPMNRNEQRSCFEYDSDQNPSAFTKMLRLLPQLLRSNAHVLVSCYRRNEATRMHELLSRISKSDSFHFQDLSESSACSVVDPYHETYFVDGYCSLYSVDPVKLANHHNQPRLWLSTHVASMPQFQDCQSLRYDWGGAEESRLLSACCCLGMTLFAAAAVGSLMIIMSSNGVEPSSLRSLTS